MAVLDFLKRNSVGINGQVKNSTNFIGDTAYEKLSNLIIKTPPLSLQKDEVCFYFGKAKSYHKKNIVTGYKGNGAGVSLRITKGVSIHTGGSGKQAIRQDVIESYNGQFFVTNKRFILLADKYGFSVSIPKILQVQRFRNGFTFYLASKQHTVLTDDVEYIAEIMNLMNEAQVNESR